MTNKAHKIRKNNIKQKTKFKIKIINLNKIFKNNNNKNY